LFATYFTFLQFCDTIVRIRKRRLMTKKRTYYFSHDTNARYDEKISAIRARYPRTGYGDWWILIEILANTENHKIQINTFTWSALALQMQCSADEVREFVEFCAQCNLLVLSEAEFYSPSLMRRMFKRNEVARHRKEAAQKRWEDEICDSESQILDAKKPDFAKTDIKNDKTDEVFAKPDAKERKEKESTDEKKKNKKEISRADKTAFGEYQNVWLTPDEHDKLILLYGEAGIKERIENMSSAIAAAPSKYKYENFYAAINNWERRRNPTFTVKKSVVSMKENSKDYTDIGGW